MWLSWIRYISWFYYGYSALMINQWDGVQDIACQSNSTEACIRTGEDVLRQLNIDEVRYWVDFYILTLRWEYFSPSLSGTFYCWSFLPPSSGSWPSSLSAGKQEGNLNFTYYALIHLINFSEIKSLLPVIMLYD